MSYRDGLTNAQLALVLLRDCIARVLLKYGVFFLITILVAVVNLAPPQLYRHFFQYINNHDDNGVLKLFAFGMAIALCSLVATAINLFAREWLRCIIEADLRKAVLDALTRTGLSELESMHRGEWIACTSGDLIQVEDFLTASFPEQIRNFLMFIGSCSLFLYHSGVFGLLPLFLAGMLIFINLAVQKRMRPAMNEIRGLHGQVYQNLLENFEGLRTIRSYRGEELVKKKFSKQLDTINKKSLTIMRSFALLIGNNEFFILTGISAVLAVMLYRLNLGSITVDDALIYPFYMGVFFMSVTSFYRSSYDWNAFLAEGGRLARLIYGLKKLEADTHQHEDNRFNLIDIELRYPGHNLLQPLFNLRIKPSEVLGIVGPSGSGKSTLLEFLAGLRPLVVQGKSMILPTTASAYVEQKPYIFQGTVADNLKFGCNEGISDEQIWAALEKTGLARLVQQRKGLLSEILDRGQNLSEGEKYRLGITRAILTNKPFLLMDEPFAALDLHSIQSIVQLINTERRFRGIVIVTHYQPTELHFDNVIDFGALPETIKSDFRQSIERATSKTIYAEI